MCHKNLSMYTVLSLDKVDNNLAELQDYKNRLNLHDKVYLKRKAFPHVYRITHIIHITNKYTVRPLSVRIMHVYITTDNIIIRKTVVFKLLPTKNQNNYS